MDKSTKLTETLDLIKQDVRGKKVAFGDVAESLNHRGFGPLLLAPALITILPTGAIPGVPAISGLFITLVAVQILCGRKYPWLPARLRKFSFKRSKFIYAVRVVRPYTKKFDNILKPRLKFLSHISVRYFVAVLCLILALLMMAIGFVPMLPAILSLPILFFALGLSAQDGAMTLAGFVLTLGAAMLIGCATGASCIDDRIVIGDPEYIRQHSYIIGLSIPQEFR